MLNLQTIRENTDLVREALSKRGETTAILDQVLKLDEERRRLVHEMEVLRAELKKTSKLIGQLMGEAGRKGPDAQQKLDESERLKADMRGVSSRIEASEAEIKTVEDNLNDLVLRIPNIPDSSVPLGKDDSENVVIQTWGEQRKFDFTPKPHWELGTSLGIIDFDRGTRLSGSRFYVLMGLGARLQRAIIAFMLNLHTSEHGYKEVYPPYMVKKECMVASGNLPKFADNLYHDAEEDFWFVPTAEVPLTSLHRDEILEARVLPINYVAYSACFRREKAAAGKDTRGIKRGHQFDKVEMYKLVAAETSFDELEKMREDAEDVCRHLSIPYRVKRLCTGDLGFASAKTYDLEMWAPGIQEWLEVSSCSNCTDFQARRAGIRYRPQPGAKPQFVHTLNGSGLALPRVLISVLENYQLPDGTVAVPTALRPYMGGAEVIK